jgi:hypothetical protein
MTCCTYPIALDDPAKGIKNERFLSPEFLATLRYAAEKARQLGLDFGVCGGTGWPFGGPSVTLRDAAQRLRAETLQPLADGKGCALPSLRAGERYLAAFSGQRDVTAFIRGERLALEPYGTPSMGFTGARFCDVPWGEQYEWKGFSFSRFTASAGHLAGKKIIGAEAWTWAGIPNRLADSLSDLKLCSDMHFLSGENALTGVDFPYSPRAEGAPGWTPYFGPVMNPNNPQWLCFPDFARYVNRCQWLLRQGKPVADVALYTPTEDAFANGSTDQMLLDFELRDRLVTGEPTDEFGLNKALRHHSDVVYSLLTNAFNFDGIDCFAVNELARVRGNWLAAGDGRYAIVVLPNLTGMDLGALEKIASFCRAGGTVIATRRLPARVYGWHQEEATQRLRARLVEMFGPDAGKSPSVHAYGRGQAMFTPDEREGLAAALAQAALGPDMRVSPFQPGDPRSGWISHVHRRAGRRDFYFVVNVGATEARFTADFRISGRTASLWHPMTGEITPLPILARDRHRTQVVLTLPPRGSVFVCFTDGGQRTPQASSTPVEITSSEAVSHPLKLTWRVTFDGPDAPPPHETRDLTSWTGWSGGRFFSGRATYIGTFESPVPAGERCWLRFEEVREVAQVVVNGHPAGAVWTAPYEVEITPLLKPGPNTLQVTVANLPVNRVLGLPDPDLRPLQAVYGERFPAPQEKQLMPEPAPSGLLGSVVLLIGSGPRS